MQSKIITTILVVGMVVPWLVMYFRKPDVEVRSINQKTIERQIETEKESLLPVIEKKETIREFVTHYKSVFDTVNIVRYQDSLITIQDTQIVIQERIILKQDTLVMSLKSDNKRLKRQRNILGIWAAGATAVAIIK